MARYVALLRGINVGGKNALSMKELVRWFSDAGCEDVATYIQSGNVVFSADPALARRAPDLIAASIRSNVSLEVPIVIRSHDELADCVAHNPFLKPDVDPKHLHVAFLAHAPKPARVKALDPNRSPGDAFVVRGHDVFLHLPNGVARTKITNAWLDSRLETTSTLRNWRTILTLLEMSR